MATITTTTTKGNKVTFNVDGDYYVPNHIIYGLFSDCMRKKAAAVLYTKVKRMRKKSAGLYTKVIKGYQYINYYAELEQAESDLNYYKSLSPKGDTIAYADVFMVINSKNSQ
jgi:two-component SAPR family response regulator